MKTAIIVILCVIGYLAIGFIMLVFHAKRRLIDESDTVLFISLWPVVAVYKIADKALTWVTNTARYLSEKLPK